MPATKLTNFLIYIFMFLNFVSNDKIIQKNKKGYSMFSRYYASFARVIVQFDIQYYAKDSRIFSHLCVFACETYEKFRESQ